MTNPNEMTIDQVLTPELDHAFDIRIEFTADRGTYGPLPGGHRQGYTPTSGGTISGPLFSGKVVPFSGADFATVRADGVVEVNSHYLIEADDGTRIYINNRGFLIPGGGPIVNGTPQPRYFRFTPTFRVPEGPHGWMGSAVFLGLGVRQQDPDHSIFRYFVVR